MNKVTSSPWGFRLTPLKEQCKWLKDHNCKYICGQFAENMEGLFSPEVTDVEIDNALQLTKQYGLSYASFNVNGDFMVYKNLDAQIEKCCLEIDRAAKFSPEIIILFAGWVERDDAEVYTQVGDALKVVSQHAAKYNLTVALENHGGLTTTAEQCNRILTKVNEANIGLNYDPANFLMYGEEPLKALEDLAFPIVFTHLKSLRMVDGKKEYCRIMDGVIDYRPILKALIEKYKYDGFLGLEYEETDDVFSGSEDDLNSLISIINMKE